MCQKMGIDRCLLVLFYRFIYVQISMLLENYIHIIYTYIYIIYSNVYIVSKLKMI